MCVSGNTLPSQEEKVARPKQRAIPRLRFRTLKPDCRKAGAWAPGRGPHPISQGTEEDIWFWKLLFPSEPQAELHACPSPEVI